jgi:hypothetical protein
LPLVAFVAGLAMGWRMRGGYSPVSVPMPWANLRMFCKEEPKPEPTEEDKKLASLRQIDVQKF